MRNVFFCSISILTPDHLQDLELARYRSLLVGRVQPRRDVKFAKGSVESTRKVPTSHYRTKHCHAAVAPLVKFAPFLGSSFGQETTFWTRTQKRSRAGHAHLDGFSRARELTDAAAGLACAVDRGGASAHAVRCRTRNAAREVAGQAKEGQGEEKPWGGEDREAQVEIRARGAPWEPSEHAEERSP